MPALVCLLQAGGPKGEETKNRVRKRFRFGKKSRVVIVTHQVTNIGTTTLCRWNRASCKNSGWRVDSCAKKVFRGAVQILACGDMGLRM